MKIGMVGLGKMGGNMVRRLLEGGHACVVFDQSEAKVAELVKEGASGARNLRELRLSLSDPAVLWLMLPAGEITEGAVQELKSVLSPQDILVDGGNSYFKDDVRRAKELEALEIRYVDVGTSGGVWGLERGYSLMIGGDSDAARYLEPIFRTLSPGLDSTPVTPGRVLKDSRTADRGFYYCGPAGSGHFVKMIHNGIEYGMMQAMAEGFQILKGARGENVAPEFRFDLNLTEIAEVWRRGSVVASWLLDLTAVALNADPELSRFTGRVPDSGEGRWTLQAAIEEAVPAPVIASALFTRFRSREESAFTEQVLSAMRNQFGGHGEAELKKLA